MFRTSLSWSWSHLSPTTRKPRTAAAQQIQQGVDDQPSIHRRATPFLGKRQQRFELLPLRFGQISRVTLGSLHPKSEPNPVRYRKPKIIFSNTL